MISGDGEGVPLAFVLDVFSESFNNDKACCTWRKLSWSVAWTEERDGP